MHITFLKGTSKRKLQPPQSLGHLRGEWSKSHLSWLLVEALYSPEEGHETSLNEAKTQEKGENICLVYSLSKMFSFTLFTLLTFSKIIPVLASRQSLWAFSLNGVGPFSLKSVHLFPFIY